MTNNMLEIGDILYTYNRGIYRKSGKISKVSGKWARLSSCAGGFRISRIWVIPILWDKGGGLLKTSGARIKTAYYYVKDDVLNAAKGDSTK